MDNLSKQDKISIADLVDKKVAISTVKQATAPSKEEEGKIEVLFSSIISYRIQGLGIGQMTMLM